jgi:hypothetical protein
MAPQSMAFLFESSVRGLSLRCDLNSDDALTPADAAIALQIVTCGSSASCDPTTLAAADVNRVTSQSY